MRVVLLIARYQEDLTWIEEVPTELEVVVVNKGEDQPFVSRGDVKVVRSDNIGREAETYVRYIVENYEDLPDRIIFTQGDPFEHSPSFLDLIKEFKAWQGFQPLTLQFKDYLPPKHIRAEYDRIANDNRIWVDRTDCFTMNNVFYDDPGFQIFAKRYRAHNGLTKSDNLVRHFLTSVGFAIGVQDRLDEINFSSGAIFSVKSEMVTKHSIDAYERLLIKFDNDNESLPYVAERCWMALFDTSSAVQESRWSLPLSRRLGGVVISTPSKIHPCRDLFLEKDAKTPTRSLSLLGKTDQVAAANNLEIHPNRDFVIQKPSLSLLGRPNPIADTKSLGIHPSRDFVIQKPSLSLLKNPNPIADTNSLGIHPSRDFVIQKPSQERQRSPLEKTEQGVISSEMLSNPRDFVITKVLPALAEPRTILKFVTSQNVKPQILTAISCPVIPPILNSDLETSEVHPYRDFVIAKAPTRHRYKV